MKKTILYVLGGFILLSVFAAMCNSEETSGGSSKDSTAVTEKSAAEAEEKNTPQKTWTMSTSKDEMRGTTNTFASIESDNEVEFEFPYSGGSTLSIGVRNTEKYGTDVYLTISKGQFCGNEFDGSNYVSIKFDDEQLRKYHFDNSSSGSMDIIFLQKKKELINKFRTAKKIIIEAPFFDAGCKQFTFTIDKPLEWTL